MPYEERVVTVDGSEYLVHIVEKDCDDRFQVSVTPTGRSGVFNTRDYGDTRQAGYVPGDEVADVVEGLIHDEMGEDEYRTPVERRMDEAIERVSD